MPQCASRGSTTTPPLSEHSPTPAPRTAAAVLPAPPPAKTQRPPAISKPAAKTTPKATDTGTGPDDTGTDVIL
ncbi:unnamed protein product [Arctia plantaginis]|uniref:Uncharacterized protein n=1 Tax=Arctia plantaginis TaxID=874455 RepID=A0A8S0ZLH2_ARCPL|nr:unnamed protein product [Arctia plantaginis]CAB3232326.1 unnamed protein product [Arctia plantaginis]